MTGFEAQPAPLPVAPSEASAGPEGPGEALARGALVNAFAFLASNLRAIFTFLVARLLGGAVLGAFGVAWAVADLAAKFGTLGLDYSVVTFVARSEAASDRVASARIRRGALTIALSASAAVSLVGFGLAWTSPLWLGIRADLAVATACLLLAVPGITAYRVCNGLSRGMKVMQHDIYARGLTESLGTSVALLIALTLGARQMAPVAAAIAGTAASGIVAFVLARRLFISPEGTGLHQTRPITWRDLLRDSLPIAAYDLLNIGIMRIDLIMLGLFVGRAPDVSLQTVGIYAVCVEIAGGLRKTSQAFTPIFTPILAEQFARHDLRGAESSYGYVARWMLALLLPAVALLGLAGGSVLRVFGPEFPQGAPWLFIVAVACALNAFVGLGETILMVQRPMWNVVNTLVAFTVAVTLNLTLIPTYGPTGAAISMLVPYLIQGILRGVEIPRLLGWRWPWRSMIRPWTLATAALPAALGIRMWVDGTGGELTAGLMYLVSYVGAWRLVGLEAEDKRLLAQFRRSAGTAAASKTPSP